MKLGFEHRYAVSGVWTLHIWHKIRVSSTFFSKSTRYFKKNENSQDSLGTMAQPQRVWKTWKKKKKRKFYSTKTKEKTPKKHEIFFFDLYVFSGSKIEWVFLESSELRTWPNERASTEHSIWYWKGSLIFNTKMRTIIFSIYKRWKVRKSKSLKV